MGDKCNKGFFSRKAGKIKEGQLIAAKPVLQPAGKLVPPYSTGEQNAEKNNHRGQNKNHEYEVVYVTKMQFSKPNILVPTPAVVPA